MNKKQIQKIVTVIWPKIIGLLFIFQGLVGFGMFFKYPELIKKVFVIIITIPYCFFAIIGGIGILLMKKWARITVLLLIIVKVIDLIVKVINNLYLPIKESTVPVYVLLGSVIILVGLIGFYISIFSYLNVPEIKERFR